MAKVVKGEERGRPGRWLVDYRDGAGVRHWRTFDSKREAENFADEHRPRARQRAGQPKVDTRIKLRDYVTRWLALVDANPRTKPATKAIYRRTLEGLWVPRFGAVRLQWLERDALRACLLGELSAGRAPNTVAIQLADPRGVRRGGRSGDCKRWSRRSERPRRRRPGRPRRRGSGRQHLPFR